MTTIILEKMSISFGSVIPH